MTILQEIRKKIRPRRRDAHKGDFGRIFILAGSKGYAGAAHLSALGALRGGAGLVTLGVPETVYSVLARRETEVMVRPFPAVAAGAFAAKALNPLRVFLRTQDVFAAGPGLSRAPGTQKLVRALIAGCPLPAVIDADGLNALVGHLEILRRQNAERILTPHPGEFRRLWRGNLTSRDSDRKTRACEAAKTSGAIVVLKGRRTVVASPCGRFYVNTTGNPGMATGGTGDVLTGLIAALLGQKFSGFDAARFGVFLHGLAGDLAAGQKGEISLTAGDLAECLPLAFRRVLGPRN